MRITHGRSGSAAEGRSLYASSYLSVGSRQQSQQQISEWYRIDQALNSLDGCALSHDIQHCWRPIALPALEDGIEKRI